MKSKKIQKFLILSVVGLLVVVLAVTLFLTIKNSVELNYLLDESVKTELMSISIAARETIDVDEFKLYNSREDVKDNLSNYLKTLESLRSLQKQVGANYIYALKEIDGRYFFVFDTDPDPFPDDPDRTDTIFEEYNEIAQVHLDAFDGIESAGILNVTDQWGTFNTSAVPIESRGKIIGIICTDIVDHFAIEGQRTATINIIILIVMLAIVMCINIVVIHRLVIKPIRLLTESFSKERSDDEPIYGLDRDDEFGELARTIQDMWHDLNESNEENRSTAAKLDAVIGNYSGVIWSIDKDETITLFNGIYLKKIGVEPSFLEGKKLTVAQEKNRHLDIIENVRATFSDGPQEWISNIDGKKFLAKTTPIYDQDGNVTSVVGSVDDMTDMMNLQEQLEEAKEKSEEASKAKSNFLANMSHEIRTPMNAIIGMVNIGKSTKDIHRKDYSLMRIEDASRHLLGVINDILDVSKIEAGKFELSPTDFDFEMMLKRVVNVIGFKVDEKELKLSVYIDRTIPKYLYGDDQRLSQVITNLLGNAIKFTPEKGSIYINTYNMGEEDDFCKVKISIMDTGIGISPDQQAKLFQSFQQAENDTTRKFGGTGLGLAISKSIIEMMDGEIWVESELGKGSTFIFTVKMKHGKGRTTKNIDWENIRFMAVDDDEYILNDFKGIIEKFGSVCDIATNGVEALNIIEKNGSYDFYFVDWKMPVMDGIEFAREIKKKQDSVVIMLSELDQSAIADAAKDVGINKFMQKPIFLSTIEDIVCEYMNADELQEEEQDTSFNEMFKDKIVLIAEDNEINLEVLLAQLEPTMVGVDSVENGREVVQAFEENPDKYDMILMDMQMPEVDGLEATRQIRALDMDKAKTIPIVAMTANVFKEDIEKCLDAGMNDHIGKPIRTDLLIETLDKYLNE